MYIESLAKFFLKRVEKVIKIELSLVFKIGLPQRRFP